MKNIITATIISEFNPFHNGHKFIIESARKNGAQAITVIISGDFVQRGDVALITKEKRAAAALGCGADLVILLPVPWAMSSAENFALGGVFAARELCSDMLVFGSESGDINLLKSTAGLVKSDRIKPSLKKYLATGVSFAKARELAMLEQCENVSAITSPNDTLAVEYISAAKSIGFSPSFFAIQRQGVLHDSLSPCSSFASATHIRSLVLNGNFNDIKNLVPTISFEILLSQYMLGNIGDISNLERAILSRLRTMSVKDLSTLPDISEGLESRIYNASRDAETLVGLYDSIKCKRYSHSRIRRLVLSAFLNLDNRYYKKHLPYLQVLGYTEKGLEILKKARLESTTPIVMRSTELKGDPLFEIECNAGNLYGLSCNNPIKCGREYTSGVIKA